MKEMVNHPQHYNAHPSGVETVDIVEELTFNLGNALKYVWRAGEKGTRIEDLRKSAWYIRREIERRLKKVVPAMFHLRGEELKDLQNKISRVVAYGGLLGCVLSELTPIREWLAPVDRMRDLEQALRLVEDEIAKG